jgi:hypothetical protein
MFHCLISFLQGSKYTGAAVVEVGVPNADTSSKRIWCTYAREAHTFDERMIAAWNKTLDVALIFVGTFPMSASSHQLLPMTFLSPAYSQLSLRLL